MVSDNLIYLLMFGFVGLLYVIGSAVWNEITESVKQVQEGSGANIYSYTCEHCGYTIFDWVQDPMIVDTLCCPQCGGVLQDQQAATRIAHDYFEQEEDGW